MTTQPLQGKKPPSHLTLCMLIAIVVGSMVGGGIFNLPQNMAAHAGGEAILIGWLITGVGMLTLCFVYQALAIRKPDLNNGVYVYARASAGEFVGFNSAWGYWVSAVLGNVSYLIAAFGALGYFFPCFGEGNNLFAFLGASLSLWLTHYFILRGIKGAALLNAIITFAKILPLLLFIVLVFLAFQSKIFQTNFWHTPTFNSPSLLEQVKNTMLVTAWVFIGIEGASVYSARAQHRSDIGKATLMGFIITLFLLMAVSLLSLGILPQAELAQLTNLSMAGVLEKIIGRWGVIIVVIGLLLSVAGAFLAWTLLAAEALMAPAKDGLMHPCLAKENKRDVPANALWLTSGMTQLFLIMTLFSKATYLMLISLATAMILIPYLFSAIYFIQTVWSGEIGSNPFQRRRDILLGIAATIYCGWILYSAGHYLLLSALLYIPGIILYILAKYQRKKPTFQPFERIVASLILTCAIAALYLLATGKINLSS